MAEPKCEIHGHRLTEIESRLSNIEADLDSIISENRNTATGLAVAERSFDLFKEIVARLEARIETLEKRIDAVLKDRRQVLAGLLANGAIGATSIAILLWALEHVK